MSKSNFLENELLDHVYGNAAYTAPTTIYVALYTSDPTDADSGTEVAGGAYARVALTNNATNFPAASGGTKSNGVEIDFGTATANWGTVTHWATRDAASGGNMLNHGSLSTSKTINSGDSAKFGVGDLDITED